MDVENQQRARSNSCCSTPICLVAGHHVTPWRLCMAALSFVGFIFFCMTMSSIHTLKPEDQIVTEAYGEKATVNGPGVVFTNPLHSARVRQAELLGPLQYALVKNTMTGEHRCEPGPKLLFLGAYDKTVAISDKIVLKQDEYVKLISGTGGSVRVLIGPQTIVPGPTEKIKQGVQKAVFLTSASAALVLSQETGQQELVTKKGVFIPGPYEEVVEERSLIHVQPHEAVIVRNPEGQFTFHIGADGDGSGTSFFLQPYHETVKMVWTAGNGSPFDVEKIDMRSQSVTFDYEVRTSDNVKLRLQGIVFWRVKSVPTMIKTTSDPMGAVLHHSRSVLIQAVSKAKLSDFMNGFNEIVDSAFKTQSTDGFYEERGVEVQSMEVTSFECVDKETAAVLQQIIQETTNRINQLQAQESKNDVTAAKLAADVKLEKQQGDVRAAKVAADIQVEKQRLEYLKTKAANDKLEASMGGEAGGLTMAKKASTFLSGLSSALPDVNQRLDLYKLQESLKSKNEDTKHLSGGSAKLFLTPQDLNLKLNMGGSDDE